MTKSNLNLMLLAAAGCLTLGTVTGAKAQVPSGLTAAECVQAQELALDTYEQAKKNTRLYPTDDDAKAAARRVFARRIKGELGEAGAGNEDDYLFAVKACTNLKTPAVSKALGLLGKIAVKGVRGPKTK